MKVVKAAVGAEVLEVAVGAAVMVAVEEVCLQLPQPLLMVHRLCLLNLKDRTTTMTKLYHILETPLGSQCQTIEQQEQDTHLMKEWVT